MRVNVKATNDLRTHEGAVAHPINAEQQLRRLTMAHLLFEDQFYIDGESAADQLKAAAEAVIAQGKAETVSQIALEARGQHNIRHASLYLSAILASKVRGSSLVRETVRDVIQRADELTEILAIYASIAGVTELGGGKGQLTKVAPHGLLRGVADAFAKFDEYQLAKYDRANKIRLRDALFLSRAKPKDDDRAALYRRLANNELVTPDTWEVALSGGEDKKASFERLLREGKLGYLALLRNLRNMEQAGVDHDLIFGALRERKGAQRVLPFRFIAAMRHAPWALRALDDAFKASVAALPRFKGRTAVLVDVSASMNDRLSAKSDMTRMDAAAALAAIFPADSVRLFSFSNSVVEVPPHEGLAAIDAIKNSQMHSGTALFDAVAAVNAQVEYDRIVVITDEQAMGSGVRFGLYIRGSVSSMPAPKGKGYVINVAAMQNGIGYGPWTHIDGFSESVIKWMQAHEA